MITITLKSHLGGEEQKWLDTHIGPRLHYIHNSIGGQGWIAQKQFKPGMVQSYWTLTFEDERYASFFLLTFPQ